MRAAVITRPGGPDVIEIQDVARPLPRDGELLVRVHASALNRADLMQREGRYPAPPGAPANIPGLEFAGEVVECGANSGSWTTGDRVFGILGGGGHAEFVVTRGDHVARIPERLSWQEAAAVPEAFITAHDALVTRAGMRAGDAVLVHAVGSGVGLAAVQLVPALGGRCYGTARTQEKIERARDLGLADGVRLDGQFAALGEAVARWTGGRGADVVLDLVGGPYTPASVECAATLGRIVLVGLLAGRSAEINLGAVLTRRLSIHGTVMRSRNAAEKAAATGAFVRDVVPLLDRGIVRPVVDRVYALEQIRDAHVQLAGNDTFGKLVLRMPS